MRVSKKTEYGIRAMVHLAKIENNRAVSIREISNIEKMPFEFLSKIFADLEKAKLVKARRGANGGYSLAKPASKITPGDVMAVLEKNSAVSHCCDCKTSAKCKSKNMWQEVEKAVINAMKKQTLLDLIK